MPAGEGALRFPVFVVGSARSGTSILVDGLFAAGYVGCREGHFLRLVHAFDRATNWHVALHGKPNDNVLSGRVDWTRFRLDILDVFRRHAEAGHPPQPWVDKTGGPEMIEAIPLLRQIWPQSRFIFAKRRGIENVISRLKKFPTRAFEKHCSEWAHNMAAWRGVRDGLADHAVEIDQQDIIRTPEGVASQLAVLLGLDAACAARACRAFVRNRPQQTEAGSAERIAELDALDWSDSQKELFLRVCGGEMALFNYSLSAGYWNA